MRTNMFRILFALTVLISVTAITSCKKDKFDEPPVTIPEPSEKDSVNTTIADLKALYTTMDSPLEITDNLWIQGVVVGDDRSGNLYKQIVIDDGTAGIAISLDQSNSYVNFPVGRKVYVRCKGLYLGDYNKLIQLGGGIDPDDKKNVSRLASALIDKFIIKGPANNTVTPIEVTIDALNASYQNRLIVIKNAEVIPGDTAKTFANAIDEQAANITFKDCNGNTIIARTSGFATFAGIKVPKGNGDLVAIYTIYGTTPQLVIRDAADLKFVNDRCGSTTTYEPKTIAYLRGKYRGTSAVLGENIKITGIVISSIKDSNNLAMNMTIQDETAGIVVRLSFNSPNFDMGDKVEINLKSTDQLQRFNGGIMQIGNIANEYCTKIGTGVVTPKVVTISQLNTGNFDDYESQLVKINDVTISGGSGKYTGTITFTDATGSIASFVRSSNPSAEFVNQFYPTGTVNIVGYANLNGSTKQVILRNTDDVTVVSTEPVTTYEPKTIAYLRGKYAGAEVALSENIKITGIVLSSIKDSNNLAMNMTIQDETAGIIVRLSSNSPNFDMGDKVEIKLRTTDKIQRFASTGLGIMQVTASNSNCTKIGTGTITPQVVTISELNTNFDDYESELVKINGVTISGSSGKYTGTITFTDATGSIASFVRGTTLTPSAEFVNQSYPTGTVNIVGYANRNNATKQVIIRNTSDVTTP